MLLCFVTSVSAVLLRVRVVDELVDVLIPYRQPYQQVQFDGSSFLEFGHGAAGLVHVHAVAQGFLFSQYISPWFLLAGVQARGSSQQPLVLVLHANVCLHALQYTLGLLHV